MASKQVNLCCSKSPVKNRSTLFEQSFTVRMQECHILVVLLLQNKSHHKSARKMLAGKGEVKFSWRTKSYTKQSYSECTVTILLTFRLWLFSTNWKVCSNTLDFILHRIPNIIQCHFCLLTQNLVCKFIHVCCTWQNRYTADTNSQKKLC